MNLAITYANLGKKTILIDADLRKPVVHNVFNLDKSPGATSYLSNQLRFDFECSYPACKYLEPNKKCFCLKTITYMRKQISFQHSKIYF